MTLFESNSTELEKNERKKLISIIVPIYNAEKYIVDCINSLFRQTYKELEIILVDDASTDNSSSICEYLVKYDPRIKVIHQKTNGGLASARNRGLDVASGDWVLFVDSDDWIADDMCGVLVEKSEKSNPDIVVFNLLEVEKYKVQENVMGNLYIISNEEKNNLIRDILDPFEHKSIIECGATTAQSRLYRTSFLKDNKIRFEENVKIHEDIPFAIDVLSRASRIAFFDGLPYMYRCNQESMTHKFRKNYQSEISILTASVISRAHLIRKLISDDETTSLLNRRVAANLLLLFRRYYCNPQNSKAYREKRKEFIALIRQKQMQNAIHYVSCTTRNLSKRLGLYLLKTKSFSLIFFANKIYTHA